jgi:hypothetical protein
MNDPRSDRTDPTTEQLRADIDSGRTGSKISKGDPAASPLGTDDEAAGTPPSGAAVAAARAAEVKTTPKTPPEEAPSGPLMRYWPFLVIGAVAVFAFLVLAQ